MKAEGARNLRRTRFFHENSKQQRRDPVGDLLFHQVLKKAIDAPGVKKKFLLKEIEMYSELMKGKRKINSPN